MKLYLAGYEVQHNSYKLLLPKETNVFLTFYYPREASKLLPKLKPDGHKGTIIIDSGAHSFFGYIGLSVTSFHKKTGSHESPHSYFKRYLEWLKENYDLYDYFVELDLQELVGYEEVEKWRDEYKNAGIFDKCILVYHSKDGFEKFEYIVHRSDCKYVGIEGIRGQQILPYNKYIKYAYDNNCKIHGFAFTRFGLLNKYPFYSTDSSSWTIGVRYGKTCVFNGTKGMNVITSTKKNFMNYNLDIEMHNSKRAIENCRIKSLHNANEYLKMETYLTNLWTARGIKWKD